MNPGIRGFAAALEACEEGPWRVWWSLLTFPVFFKHIFFCFCLVWDFLRMVSVGFGLLS